MFSDLSPPYSTIVADPPWPSMHGRATYHRGKPERYYSVMTLEDIEAMPVYDLVDADAHLWIWAVNRLLGQAWRIAEAWGFTPLTIATWCKPGPGMGYYLRNNTEHAIFATRGRPMPPDDPPTSTWWQWPRGPHSAKPAAFFDLVEQVSPGPYVELFSRTPRLGWDSWGDGYEIPNAV